VQQKKTLSMSMTCHPRWAWVPPLGSCVVVHNQIVALFYMFYISSALIVAGRDTAATVWRGAFLRTKLAVILVELLWNAWHPAALPVKAVAAALLLSVLANGVNYLGAYGLLPADLATFDAPFSFGLHVIAQVAAIPINQLGNVFVLREQKSQARYRMAAWIIALAVSTVVLVQPWSAAAPVTLLLASAPSLLILTMLARQHRDDENADATVHEQVGEPPVALPAPEDANNIGSDAAAADAGFDPSLRVSTPRACVFLVLACVVGSNGEALLDMQTSILVRRALADGNSDQQLANNVAVISSMVGHWWVTGGSMVGHWWAPPSPTLPRAPFLIDPVGGWPSSRVSELQVALGPPPRCTRSAGRPPPGTRSSPRSPALRRGD
jgi:hypothetical protein